jgi:hypothetical protein
MSVKIGTMSPDILANLFSGTDFSSAEKYVMLKNMHQTIGFLRLVLGSQVKGKNDIENRECMPFIQENPHAVFELKIRKLGLFRFFSI